MPIILFVIFVAIINLLRPGTLADVGVAEDDRHTEVHINQEAVCEAVGWSVSGGAYLQWRNRGTRDQCDPDFRGLITQEVNAGRLRPVVPDGYQLEGGRPMRAIYKVIVHVPNLVYPEEAVTHPVLITWPDANEERLQTNWREVGLVYNTGADPMVERVRMSWIIMVLPFGQIVLTMLLLIRLGMHLLLGPNRPRKEPSYWDGCWDGFKDSVLDDWKSSIAALSSVVLMGMSVLFRDELGPDVVGGMLTLSGLLLIPLAGRCIKSVKEEFFHRRNK